MTPLNELVLQVRVIITAGLEPSLVVPLVRREREKERDRKEVAALVSLVLLSSQG